MSTHVGDTDLERIVSSLLPDDYEPVTAKQQPDGSWKAWPSKHDEYQGVGKNKRSAVADLLRSILDAD